MSHASFEYETPNGFPEPSQVKRILMQTGILLVFLSLVAVPVSIYGCRTERARWTAAKAMNLYAAGESDEAIQQLRQAVESSGNDPAITVLLADLLVSQDRATEAISLCTRILENEPNRVLAIQAKSNAEQKLDRPFEALNTLKSMYPYLKQEEAQQATRRNNLAYFRALADHELDEAYEDILSVLRDQSVSSYWSTEVRLSLESQALISIALISRNLGEHGDGTKLLDRKIENLEHWISTLDSQFLSVVYDGISGDFPPKPKWERETTGHRSEIEQTLGELAFLLVARALLAQETGDLQQCKTDRIRIRELGFSSDRLAEQLPADAVCLNTLRLAATLLDTYGYVLYRMGEFGEALPNLDLAITATDYQILSLENPLRFRGTETLEFDSKLIESELKKTLAVVCYHRMLLHRAMGSVSASNNSATRNEIDLEKADAARIRELGFDPNSRLY